MIRVPEKTEYPQHRQMTYHIWIYLRFLGRGKRLWRMTHRNRQTLTQIWRPQKPPPHTHRHLLKYLQRYTSRKSFQTPSQAWNQATVWRNASSGLRRWTVHPQNSPSLETPT
jgi:hypothetical protein